MAKLMVDQPELVSLYYREGLAVLNRNTYVAKA